MRLPPFAVDVRVKGFPATASLLWGHYVRGQGGERGKGERETMYNIIIICLSVYMKN